MSLGNKLGLGPPSAAKLAEHIAAAAAECEQAEARFAAADAAAVAASTDGAEYDKAAETARQARAALEAAKEKVERLRQAHAAAAEREQRDYIARQEKNVAERRVAYNKAHVAAAGARKAEESRHEQALKEIEANVQAAQAAVSRAEDALRRAREGLTESAVQRISELRTELGNVRRKCGEDLDEKYRDANAHWRNCRNRLEAQEAMSRRGALAAGAVAETRREMEAAKKEEDALEESRQRRTAETRHLTEEIQRIESAGLVLTEELEALTRTGGVVQLP